MGVQKDFLLPDLGEGLEEAEVVTWRVAEGERVELNQPLVEVNTAKALVEIPSPFAGTVVKLHAAEGDVVNVGSPLVTIDVEGGDEIKPKRRPVLVGYGVEEDEPAVKAGRGPGARAREREPVAASPPVRRLAKELGVDLAAVTGTGPDGRVTREDVEGAAPAGAGAAPAASPEAVAGQRVPVRGVRRLVAEKMARSWREIPHVTTFLTLDATSLEAFREEVAADADRRISPLPIVVKALAEICVEHPKLNASFDADAHEIVLREECHVGIATDTERGLMVTVVRDVRGRGLLEVADEIERLVRSAREGTSKPEDVTGSTITVTNVGTFGAEYGTPIINIPEAVILALGVIEPRALVVDGEVAARSATTLSLSFDHRVLDGAEAGRALRALADFLQSPFKLGSLAR